jgi:hypothetical protein
MNFKDNSIPIIIICYNNYKYVENTIYQIINRFNQYLKDIYILDNYSNCQDTINFLNKISMNIKVIFRNQNNGPWITETNNSDIYNILPNKFIITDPDLELNEYLPNNFVEILSNLSDKYNCNKIGFALDISDFNEMYPSHYSDTLNIKEWEDQFWTEKVYDDTYDIYRADIDTTFCLINKNNLNHSFPIRVAGNFTAKHLPWYINNKIFNVYENYLNNNKTTGISTISRIVNPYISEHFLNININNQIIFLKKNYDNENLNIEKFNYLDKILSKNKIFIDFCDSDGITSIYASRKSKYVYCIILDKKNHNNILSNLKNNCKNNYTIIYKEDYDKFMNFLINGIYSIDDYIIFKS